MPNPLLPNRQQRSKFMIKRGVKKGTSTISSLIKMVAVPFLLLFLPGVSLSAVEGDLFPFLGEIIENDVNIRAGQSASFDKVGRLAQKEKVIVVEKSYSWYKIRLPSHAVSYIHAKYVNPLGNNIGEIIGDRLNIRAGPGVDHSPLGQLEKGALVRLLEQKDEWYRIEPVDQSYGWVMDKFVRFVSRDVPPALVVQRPPDPSSQSPSSFPRELVQEPKEQIGILSAVGVVQGLGEQVLSNDIRHRLVSDDQKIYNLKGYRSIIDGFLHHKVAIEGTIQPDVHAKEPVILVTKITLVL
jgi:SH3-like domain-containing protein